MYEGAHTTKDHNKSQCGVSISFCRISIFNIFLETIIPLYDLEHWP